MTDLPELIVADATAWQRWLTEHHQDSAGVRLVLAKKGTDHPTSLAYDQALDEALCHGWIDGQVRRRDDATYMQRFTPRKRKSAWSRRNVGLAEQLIADGRMQAAGLGAIEQAKADGRWAAAYAGPATIEVPADLVEALEANPTARSMFDLLTSQNRYAILYRLNAAKRADTRSRRIAEFVAMLARAKPSIPSPAGSTDRSLGALTPAELLQDLQPRRRPFLPRRILCLG